MDVKFVDLFVSVLVFVLLTGSSMEKVRSKAFFSSDKFIGVSSKPFNEI